MNTMFGFHGSYSGSEEPGPEQYLGEDGLIYCGKCHTPVQCRITLRQRTDHALHLQMPEGRTGTAGTAYEGGRAAALCPSSKSGRYPGATSSGLDICISDGYSQRPDGETVYGELEEGQRQKPWYFYFGAMLEQENHSWLPVLLMHCWKKVFLS